LAKYTFEGGKQRLKTMQKAQHLAGGNRCGTGVQPKEQPTNTIIET